MYETMLNDVKEKMKPVTDMAEINKRTAERLIALQTAYMNDLFTSGFAQMNALATVRDVRQAAEMQMNYFKQLEVRTTETAEQEVAVLTEAREQMTALVEKSVSDMNSQMPWAEQMSSLMNTFKAGANVAGTNVVEPAEKAEPVADGVKKVAARRKTAA
ncbi:MAG: phasin family protein [Marinobacterium sp.]|nr:phasin family protein [Marinobacterium sp.]